MDQARANQIALNSSRCTEAVMKAFSINNAVPQYTSGILGKLIEHNYKCTPLENVNGKTINRFFTEHPNMLKCDLVITTNNHALALVDGYFIDTASRNPLKSKSIIEDVFVVE